VHTAHKPTCLFRPGLGSVHHTLRGCRYAPLTFPILRFSDTGGQLRVSRDKSSSLLSEIGRHTKRPVTSSGSHVILDIRAPSLLNLQACLSSCSIFLKTPLSDFSLFLIFLEFYLIRICPPFQLSSEGLPLAGASPRLPASCGQKAAAVRYQPALDMDP